jgi:pyridoxine 5'-phosphate synthase PdxJ
MNKQQTAVEWLSEQFDSIVELYPSEYEKVNRAIEQAKEMEKEQMKKTASYWQKMGILVATKIPNRKTFEQWFSETYGGNK